MQADSFGKLHEVLVSKFINGDKYTTYEAEIYSETIKDSITTIEYNNSLELAKYTAENILSVLSSPIEVNICSKPGDIKRYSGIAEEQTANPSDILLKYSYGFVGLSLKASSNSNKNYTIKNIGVKKIDGFLGTNSYESYINSRKELIKCLPHYSGKSLKNIKYSIRDSLSETEILDAKANVTFYKIREMLYDKLIGVDETYLKEYSNRFLVHSPKFPVYKVSSNKNVATVEPIKTDFNIFSIRKSGNNSIVFTQNDGSSIKQRLKAESSPLVSPLKITLERNDKL